MPNVIATPGDPQAATLAYGASTIFFRLLLQSPEQSREAQVAVQHIPGGNINYVDIGGLMPAYIRGQALFSSYADFLNLRDFALGTAATLTYAEGSYSVWLTKIARNRVPSSNGYMTATVEFLINL